MDQTSTIHSVDTGLIYAASLALFRTFCPWKIEHQLRKCCVKGLILKNMAGRERDACRLYECGYNTRKELKINNWKQELH